MKKSKVKITLFLTFLFCLTKESLQDDEIAVHPESRTLSSCSCGITKGVDRIVGGENVNSKNEIPWRCSLFYKVVDGFDPVSRLLYYSYDLKCGCTIISKRWALTATHCLPDIWLRDGQTPYLLAGVNHLAPSQNTTMSHPVRIKKVHKHQSYNKVTKDNDIALLELSEDLPFGRNIAPACLPYKHRRNKFYKKTGTVSGFGNTQYGRESNASEVLNKVDLPILTTKQCRKAFNKTRINITDNMFCTYEKGKDACQGDSGSGLDFKDEDTGITYVIGVVSWGIGCASAFPGAYTKVAKYLNFIENTTGQQFCKI